MGLARYMAVARLDDPERTTALADDLVSQATLAGPVLLLHCGGRSHLATEVERALHQLGRSSRSLVVADRALAQDERTLQHIAGTSAIWVFADDLLQAFVSVFATQLAFGLRARARRGLPVVGIGGGALAISGLMLASRICSKTEYELVAGLGWTPRLLVDGELHGSAGEPRIARATVESLPGLLGLDLGAAGAVRVEGSRIESVGADPVVLLGADGTGAVCSVLVEPGQTLLIAPPPFAPFERALLGPEALRALRGQSLGRQSAALAAPSMGGAGAQARVASDSRATLRQAPEPPATAARDRVCPMCKQVHAAAPHLELAA